MSTRHQSIRDMCGTPIAVGSRVWVTPFARLYKAHPEFRREFRKVTGQTRTVVGFDVRSGRSRPAAFRYSSFHVRSAAIGVRNEALKAIKALSAALDQAKTGDAEAAFVSLHKQVGLIIGHIQMSILEPIVAEHPDLDDLG